MYNKTTSANFLKYGKPLKDFIITSNLKCTNMSINKKLLQEVVCFDQDITLNVDKGMGMLVIYDNDELFEYAIHRHIRINKGVKFGVVPIDDSIIVSFYNNHDAQYEITRLPNPYVLKNIKSSFELNDILVYYYVVKGPGYHFDGETHNFYELTYVDNGTLKTTIDNHELTLNAHDLCIYGPKQFHAQAVTSDSACSYLTIIFEMHGIDDTNLLNRTFSCSKELTTLIEQFSKNTDSKLIYADDFLIVLLKTIIIRLLQYNDQQNHSKPTSHINQFFEDKLLEEITTYINNHLYEPLPIDQICASFSISRSSLQNLFKDNLNTSPKRYINELKMARSKILIRKSEYTISEISNMLGFASIHYFSRKFTQRYGLAPSEYARKIYDN